MKNIGMSSATKSARSFPAALARSMRVVKSAKARSPSASNFAETIDYAVLADQLGLDLFALGEHRNMRKGLRRAQTD
jgi:alkanesulfonate monooxygenase SsuD/methylene tetrahydromethanopterin reductase-like flavin-dependent oxidoreductase (luciferase family)